MDGWLSKIGSKIRQLYLTISRGSPKITPNREVTPPSNRELPRAEVAARVEPSPRNTVSPTNCRVAEKCPYCGSEIFIKRGTRKKVHEVVQLYQCQASACGRTFTAQPVKGAHYPQLALIDSLSFYNLGFSAEEAARLANIKFGTEIGADAVQNWAREHADLCRFSRMREFAVKLYKPRDMVEVVTMAHRQLYRFRYHRGKTKLILQEYPNRRFGPLQEYLDGVSSETPHQYFQDGLRISEVRSKFDKAQMIVRSKQNFANKMAEFVLKAVTENKNRHEELQRFFLANDSVTIATEVPVYIRREDIEHMENQLKFQILPRSEDGEEWYLEIKGQKEKLKGVPKLLTGHIDFVQIRNGAVHILDYKPNAAKEKPIEQLTWYALALSRLTGLRLFEFKCAWFDEKDYFEFYPLHVVHKLSEKKRRKRVLLKGGVMVSIPKKNELQVV